MEDRIYIDVAVGSSLLGTDLHLVAGTNYKDVYTVLYSKVIDLEERAVRDALINLGWSPPYVGEI